MHHADPIMPLEVSTKPSPEDKVRKDLVQVFFGLVLTQIAIYASALIQLADNIASMDYWAAWSHVVLSFTVTTTSWFGWQIYIKTSKIVDSKSIFQGSFLLSLLDIFLVTLYFLLVHQIEIVNVSAFPNDKHAKLTGPSSLPESIIILIVYSTYFVWDLISIQVDKKKYAPWPSAICAFLAIFAILLSKSPEKATTTIWIDFFLLTVVILFRALKRFQKWNAGQDDNNTRGLFRAPISIKLIFWICVTLTAFSFICCLIA